VLDKMPTKQKSQPLAITPVKVRPFASDRGSVRCASPFAADRGSVRCASPFAADRRSVRCASPFAADRRSVLLETDDWMEEVFAFLKTTDLFA